MKYCSNNIFKIIEKLKIMIVESDLTYEDYRELSKHLFNLSSKADEKAMEFGQYWEDV